MNRIKAIGLVVLLASCLGAPLRAEASDPFYQGKQIQLIVGTAAGQDYDIWARLIGRHLGNHLAGNPKIVVEDMPGAGHIIATNYLYNQAARDGTVLGMVTRNIVDAAVLHITDVRFDPTKFNWIGSPELTHRVLLASSQSGITKVEDLFQHELIIGATGEGQAVTTAPILLKNLVGLKIKVVTGYHAPQDVVLAMQRNEVGGIVDTIGGAKDPRRQWIASGSMRILFNMEPEPVASFGAPSLFQYLKMDKQRQVFDFLAGSMELGRPIFAPPGVPAERVADLRKAFRDMVTDPDFLKDADSTGFDVSYRSGEDIEARVAETMQTPKDIADIAQAGATLN
jgi:tripartite-type tricarboxylate transporter receptor subunit TctC